MTVEPFGLNVFPSGSWRHDCSRKHRRRKAKSTGRRSRTLLLACAYRLPVNDNCQCQESGLRTQDSGLRTQDSSEESNPSLRFFVKEPVVALTPSAHLLIGDCCRKENCFTLLVRCFCQSFAFFTCLLKCQCMNAIVSRIGGQLQLNNLKTAVQQSVLLRA